MKRTQGEEWDSGTGSSSGGPAARRSREPGADSWHWVCADWNEQESREEEATLRSLQGQAGWAAAGQQRRSVVERDARKGGRPQGLFKLNLSQHALNDGQHLMPITVLQLTEENRTCWPALSCVCVGLLNVLEHSLLVRVIPACQARDSHNPCTVSLE